MGICLFPPWVSTNSKTQFLHDLQPTWPCVDKFYCNKSNLSSNPSLCLKYYNQLFIISEAFGPLSFIHTCTTHPLVLVFNDRQARSICWNTCATFVNEPPAKSTAMQIRKLPAGALVPGIKSWLCQVNSFPQPGLIHTVLITTSVPICVAVTSGLLPIQQKMAELK